MYAINASEHKPASNAFDAFLAKHGIGKVKQIVDAHDTMLSAYRSKDKAAEVILDGYREMDIKQPDEAKRVNLNLAILDDAIRYVTKKEGRIIPVGEEKGLEAKVNGTDASTLVPITQSTTYTQPREQEVYERVPKKQAGNVVPISYAGGTRRHQRRANVSGRQIVHYEPTNPSSASVDSVISHGYKRTFGARRGLRVAASLALVYLVNTFSGLSGVTQYEARSAEPDPLARVESQLRKYEELEKKVLEKAKKKKAEEEAAKASPVAPTATPAPVQPQAQLIAAVAQGVAPTAADHSTYNWKFNQRSEDRNSPEMRAWYSLQPYKVQFRDDKQYFVGVTLGSSYDGADKNEFFGGMRLGKWFLGLKLGNEEQNIIEVSEQVYNALKGGRLKPQSMMYKLDDPKKELRIYASVNPGKKKQAKPKEELLLPKKILFQPDHLTVPKPAKTFTGEYKGKIPFVPEHLTEPN